VTVLDNIGDWPARWARRRGDSLAVADAARRLDWAAFETRVARVAGWLRAAGVGRGDRVAFLLQNRTAALEIVLGAARLGAITLPVNLRLSAREIAYQLDDCRPAVLFHEADLDEAVSLAAGQCRHAPALRVALDDGGACRYESEVQAAAPVHASVPVDPDDPAILMYTSGTTGSPKGALLPHRKALYNSLNAVLDFGIRSDDRVLVVAPLFHSLGLQILSLPVLYAGASLVLQPRFDPDAVWGAVASDRITYFGGVPAMHQRLRDALAARGRDALDLSSLRFVFTAGSAVSIELIRDFERRGILLVQGFGQTETSTLCCLRARDAVRKAGSVGRPVFHAELRIVTLASRPGPPETWRDAAPGETGEIVVRGPITMLGYWEKPEATAETLIEGWLCTGDLGQFDDEGFVTLVGRSRDMIISGGENVYPAEVEAVFREHPSIREIAVVGVPDARWGEIGRAHVLLEEGSSLDREALDAWARERLAVFKIPKAYVVEQELPRTASGKIRKHRLIAEHADPRAREGEREAAGGTAGDDAPPSATGHQREAPGGGT
jgi:fatty-acyl-CoA synthase